MATAVFLSYRRADSKHAAGRIRSDLSKSPDLHIFLDVEVIAPGDRFPSSIQAAVTSADFVVCIIGPTWTIELNERQSAGRRDWVKLELELALSANRQIIPVLLDSTPMPDRNDLPESLRDLSDHASIRLRHETFRDDVSTLARVLGAADRGATQWFLPPRNVYFTDRKASIETLLSSLQNPPLRQSCVIIHGPQGVGKTQLAVEYAYQNASIYDLVLMLPVDQPARCSNILRRVGDYLGALSGAPDAEQIIFRTLQAINARTKTLIIYDNADSYESIERYWLSAAGGHRIVTSLDGSWDAIGPVIRIDALPAPDGILLLERRSGLKSEEVSELAADLGYFPLALDQAGAYLRETGMSGTAYHELLRRAPEQMAVRGTPAFYDGRLASSPASASSRRRVALVWELSVNKATLESPAARELLDMCAFYASQAIPRTLLTASIESNDELVGNDALAALARYGLLRVNHSLNAVFIHRLIQKLTYASLTIDERGHTGIRCLGVMQRQFPQSAGNSAQWAQASELLAHAISVLRSTVQFAYGDQSWINLADRVMSYMRGAGRLGDARSLAEIPSSKWSREVGVAWPSSHLRACASVLRELGDLADSKALLDVALFTDTNARAVDDMASDQEELCWTLREIGQPQAAMLAGNAALATCGPTRSSLLRAVAATHIELGQIEAAKAKLALALTLDRADEAIQEDWSEAEDLRWLGRAYTEDGDPTMGLLYAEQAYERHMHILGQYHWRVGEDLRVIAHAFFELDSVELAYDNLDRALTILEGSLGPRHWRVAECLILRGALKPAMDGSDQFSDWSLARSILQRSYESDHMRLSKIDNAILAPTRGSVDSIMRWAR